MTKHGENKGFSRKFNILIVATIFILSITILMNSSTAYDTMKTSVIDNGWEIKAVDCENFKEKTIWTNTLTEEICFNVTNNYNRNRELAGGIEFVTSEDMDILKIGYYDYVEYKKDIPVYKMCKEIRELPNRTATCSDIGCEGQNRECTCAYRCFSHYKTEKYDKYEVIDFDDIYNIEKAKYEGKKLKLKKDETVTLYIKARRNYISDELWKFDLFVREDGTSIFTVLDPWWQPTTYLHRYFIDNQETGYNDAYSINDTGGVGQYKDVIWTLIGDDKSYLYSENVYAGGNLAVSNGTVENYWDNETAGVGVGYNPELTYPYCDAVWHMGQGYGEYMLDSKLDYNSSDIVNSTKEVGLFGNASGFHEEGGIIFSYDLIPNATAYDEGTVMFWINMNQTYDNTRADTDVPWAKDTTAFGGMSFQFLNGDGRLRFQQQDSGASYQTFSTQNSWTAGEWYHIAGTWSDTNGMRFYVNGILNDTHVHTGGWYEPQDLNISVGGYWQNDASVWSHFINGTMDEVRIYNTELSQNEIEQHYLNSIYGDKLPLNEMQNQTIIVDTNISTIVAYADQSFNTNFYVLNISEDHTIGDVYYNTSTVSNDAVLNTNISGMGGIYNYNNSNASTIFATVGDNDIYYIVEDTSTSLNITEASSVFMYSGINLTLSDCNGNYLSPFYYYIINETGDTYIGSTTTEDILYSDNVPIGNVQFSLVEDESSQVNSTFNLTIIDGLYYITQEATIGNRYLMDIDVKDEETGENIYFDINIYNTTHNITFNDVTNFTGVYTEVPYGDVTIELSNSTGEYVTRNYYTTITSCSDYNNTLYMLKTDDGQYVNFITSIRAGSIISGAEVEAYKQIGGVYTLVEEAVSDGSGNAPMWLSPDTTYRIDASATGYDDISQFIRPTLTTYYLYFSESDDSTREFIYDNIEMAWYPLQTSISPRNDTEFQYNINWTINSLDDQLTGYDLTCYWNGTYLNGSSGGDASGETLEAWFNITGNITNVTLINCVGEFTKTGYSINGISYRNYAIYNYTASSNSIFAFMDTIPSGVSSFILILIATFLGIIVGAGTSNTWIGGGVSLIVLSFGVVIGILNFTMVLIIGLAYFGMLVISKLGGG